MIVRRTIKIKVDFPKENLLMLLKTCSQVFNDHIDWAFNNKSFSKQKAHKELYNKIRIQYPNLPSGLI